MDTALNTLNRNKFIIAYTLAFFIVTRICLTIIGVAARAYPPKGYVIDKWEYSQYSFIDLWGMWDSGWYTNIAQNGYSDKIGYGQSNLGYFPAYPLLIRSVSFTTGNHYLSGLLISNIALFVAAFYLYRLTMIDSDKNTAIRSVKYLFLHPTGFILSAVFSESLFLAFLIAAFYYAQRSRWLIVGICGFLLVLTKPIGIIIFPVFILEYLKTKDFKIKNVKPEVCYLLLVPLGLLLFSAYLFYLTGDWLAYYHVKKIGWDVTLTNPLSVIALTLGGRSGYRYTVGLTFVIGFFLLNIFYKKIGLTYWFFGLSVLLVTLASGMSTSISILRQSLIIFPFYILFAKLGSRYRVDLFLTALLFSLQALAMVYWSTGFYII